MKKKLACIICLVLSVAGCSSAPPAPARKPAAEPPADLKTPGHSSTRNAYAQKSRSTTVARQARLVNTQPPISHHAHGLKEAHSPQPEHKAAAVSDTVLEDAVLCKLRLSLYGYEKHLRDARLVDGEASDTAAGTRLFLPSRPVTVLGKPVGKFVLAGDDESDYAQLLVLVNSQPDTVAAAVRSKNIKLAKRAGGYKSSRQPQGVVLISGQGNSTTVSCGYQPG